MLAIISAEAWYTIQYQQYIGEDFQWIIILVNFVEISFVFFSTTFFILAHEHFKETLSLKLFVSAALCLELIHGAIYYSALCCTQLTWIFILPWNMAAFCLVEVVVVVFAKPTKYSELQNKSSSNGRQSLVRRMIKGLRNPFVIFYLVYLGLALHEFIYLTVFPGPLVEGFFCLSLYICSCIFGFVLPTAFSELFNIPAEVRKENECVA